MPSTVIASAVISSFAIESAIAIAAVKLATAVVTSIVISKLFAPQTPDGAGAETGSDPGIKSRLSANTENKVGVVYGSAWVKGAEIHGENTEDFSTAYYCVAICEAIETDNYPNTLQSVYWQEYLLTLGTDGWVTTAMDANGNAIPDFNDNVRVQFFANGLPVDRTSLPNTTWFQDATKLMSGYTTAVITVKYNRDKQIFSLADMTYQIMNGLSAPGSVIKNYFTSTRYGAGQSLSLIDQNSLTALDAYSNQMVPYTDSGGMTQTAKRYQINGTINPNTNTWENMETIARSAGSLLRLDNSTGQFSVFIDQPWVGPVAYTFDDSNIVGRSSITLSDVNSIPNTLQVLFANGESASKGQLDTFTLSTPANLLPVTAPNTQQQITLPLTNNSVQAKRLATLELNQWQLDLSFTFETDHRAIGLVSGDVVAITDSKNGWLNKLFRIASISETETSSGAITVEVSAKEYSAAIYDEMVVQYDPAPNLNTPSARALANFTPNAPTVTGPMPTAGIPFFTINVTIPNNYRVETVEIYYSMDPVNNFMLLLSTSAVTASGAFAPGTVAQAITGLLAGTYYFRTKYYNSDLASDLSAASLPLTWAPNPSSSVSGVAANPEWTPPSIVVPTDAMGGGAVVGQTPTLCLYLGTTLVQFSTAASSALLPNNQWRIVTSTFSTGLTATGPTVSGQCAQYTVTSLTSQTATLTVELEYKGTTGIVSPLGDVVLQAVQQRAGVQGNTGPAGTSGNQNAIAYLYQWALTTPSSPNGDSTFQWASLTNTNYTGGNGWSVSVPNNPGTAGLNLWTATKGVSAASTATMTTIDWTMGTVTVSNFSQNGQNGTAGLSRAIVSVYQWSTPPAPTITGTSTYTWANGTFTPVPSGWTLTPGNPTTGQYLYKAEVTLAASATTVSSSIDWTTATVSVQGFAAPGTPGASGNSSRYAYALATGIVTPTGTVTTVGNASFPSNSDFGVAWASSWTATLPTPASGETIYVSIGIFDGTNTVWNTPYLGTFRVGSLSALSVNTGGLSVTGTVQAGNLAPSGTTVTGSGFYVNNSGQFGIGNTTTNIVSSGTGTITLNGKFVSGAANIQDLSVQTLNIAGNAVSVVTTAYTTGTVSFGSSGGGTGAWNNLQSVTITSTGSQPILLQAGFSFLLTTGFTSGSAAIQLLRDSTQINFGQQTTPLGNAFAFLFLDEPPAGTYTYSFQVRSQAINFAQGTNNGSGGNCSNRLLTAVLVKK